MARMNDGLLGGLTGKIGPVCCYESRGQQLVRALPKKRTKVSEKELASRQVLRMLNPLLASVKRMTKVGFMLSVTKKTNTYNEAFRCNRNNNVVAGRYPGYYLDFSRLQIAEGEKESPVNASVTFDGEVIRFNWEEDESRIYECHRDQLLLMAYSPDPKFVTGMAGGQLRNQGFGQLEVMRFHKPYVVHTYIAFMSDLRDQISNSVYAGQLIIPAQEK